jgi:hypothetical protein
MNKGRVKIIKPGGKKAAKAKMGLQSAARDAVNNWVSERQENSRLEKVFSEGKIMEWKSGFKKGIRRAA